LSGEPLMKVGMPHYYFGYGCVRVAPGDVRPGLVLTKTSS
jgi:hypothetical protein